MLNGIEDIYPLSPAQQAMLVHCLSAPGSGLYVEQLSCLLEGGIVMDAFQSAWQSAVDRHTTLRTGFLFDDLPAPMQFVCSAARVEFDIQDWRIHPRSEQDSMLPGYLAAGRALGLDLSSPPLIKLALLRVHGDAFRFVLTFHHLILDGWSVTQLLDEVLTAYTASVNGQEFHPAPAPPFRDYVAWLETQDLSESEAFWRKFLAGMTRPAPLRAGPFAQPTRVREFADVKIRVEAGPASELFAAARRQRTTLNTLIQAAWALVLCRYNRAADVVFGAAVSGRPAAVPGIERMLGNLINTIPVRIRVEREKTLHALLAAMREKDAELQPHEHLPLAKIQECGDLPAGVPLFESLVVFQNYPMRTFGREDGGVRIRELYSPIRTKYPVTLVIAAGSTLSLNIITDRGRLPHDAASEMLADVQFVLGEMVKHPERRVESIALPSVPRTPFMTVPQTDQSSVVEMFQRQASSTPRALAIGGTERMDYETLDKRANELAWRLIRLGVGPEDPVIILLPPSARLVVAIMATLKAGAVCAPIDPDDSAEWASTSIGEIRPKAIIAVSDTAPQAAPGNVSVLLLDRDSLSIATESSEPPKTLVVADQAVWFLRTCGTAGAGRIAVATNRALARLIQQLQAVAPLTINDRVLHASDPSHCGTLREILWPLCSGAAIVFLANHATVTTLTPALLNSETAFEANKTRLAFWTGEPLFGARLPREIFNWSKVLRNAYAVAEAPGLLALGRRDGENPEAVPISAAPGSDELLILDDLFACVPFRVAGEMYAAGECLARGYYGNPKLTAERFIPDSITNRFGARLFRTGDLARRNPDGSIHYISRLGDSVDFLGVPALSGDVLSAVHTCPGIGEALVLPGKDSGFTVFYVGTVVDGPHESEVHSYLRRVLPTPGPPVRPVRLAALPRNRWGRHDRARLMRLLASQPDLEPSALRTPTEQIVAGLWADLLGQERIGSSEDLMELGGNSLLATQFVSRIRRIFQLDLPLTVLFETPTIAALATAIDTQVRSDCNAAPPMAPVPRIGELPLALGQERLWFLDQLEPDSPRYNVPQAVRVTGALDVGVLEQTLTRVVERHEVLRTTFIEVEGRPVQRISPALPVRVPLVDLSRLQPEDREREARRLIEEDALQPFNLRIGPPLRIGLFRLADLEHVLTFTLHHIVSDAWSMGILIRDMAQLYRSCLEGKPSTLPELGVQYADYAVWQRGWLEGGAGDLQLKYWKRVLAGAPAELNLATDCRGSAARSYRGARYTFEFAPQLSRAARALGREEGATTFMTLLAAFKALLYCLTHQTDIVIGTDIANRTRLETEPLVGFFVNLLVMRTDLSGNPSFRELLRRVRGVAVGAYAHQDLPFDQVVAALRPDRSSALTPLIRVLFVLQNVQSYPVDLPGLVFRPFDFETPTARFELAVFLKESERGILGSCVYSTEMFTADNIARMMSNFRTVIQAVTADPNLSLDDLRVLEDSRRAALVGAFNDELELV